MAYLSTSDCPFTGETFFVQGGVVKRVLKFANFKDDKKMVPVVEGELLVELGPVPKKCPTCDMHILDDGFTFCPGCGQKL